MDLGLAGRVAIVTGASRGIGKACAAELAAEGAAVVLLSRDGARNAAACAELASQAKDRVVGAPADLNDEPAVSAVFARTMAEFGRLDILVNCAAVVGRGDFFALDEAKWARMFEDKLDGTARCLRLAVPLMRRRKWGRIVNVLGGAARQPQPAAVSVGLNNAAILNLIKAVAGDLARDNILINAVIRASSIPSGSTRRSVRMRCAPASRKRRCEPRGSPASPSDAWGRAAKSVPSSPSSPPSAQASSPEAPGRWTAAPPR